MEQTIKCPICSEPADPFNTACPKCGTNLAMAIAQAADQVEFEVTQLDDIPVSPEVLTPRIGDYLVKKGYVREQDLELALRYQKEQQAEGNTILLGKALIILNLIDKDKLDRAITAQILDLHKALRNSNKNLEQRVEERTVELQNAMQKLKELNQLKNNFVSNISHELRTPLAHMIGYVDILSDGTLGNLNEDQDHAINVIAKAYTRLSGLIENLIEFSLLTHNGMTLNTKPVSAKIILETVEAHSLVQAKENGSTIKSHFPDGDILIELDFNKITWVMEELVVNAIKFSQPEGLVEFGIRKKDNMAVFFVSDHGIGIPQDKFEEIFEPFHQLDGSSTRKVGGTGMGLSMVRQILDAHSTKIKVISSPGEGSTFKFQLPMKSM